MQAIPSRKKPLAFAIGIILSASPFLAHAIPATFGAYTIDAEYVLGSSSGPIQDGMSDSLASTYVSSNGADYYLNRSSGQDNVFFHTYGSGDASSSSFGARASGEGSFFTRTAVNYHAVFTNTASVAQNFSFNFGVQEGEIGISGLGAGFADLLLSVRVNGADVARDQTTLVQAIDGTRTCTSNDMGVLSSYMNCNSNVGNGLIAPGNNYSLALGLIAAGSSLTLDYDIVSTAYGDLSNGPTTSTSYVCDQWDGGNGYGYGDGGYGYGGNCLSGHYESYTYNAPGSAIARSGDPINQFWNPAALSGTFSSVPEPSSVALLSLALVGMGVARRRKR